MYHLTSKTATGAYTRRLHTNAGLVPILSMYEITVRDRQWYFQHNALSHYRERILFYNYLQLFIEY